MTPPVTHSGPELPLDEPTRDELRAAWRTVKRMRGRRLEEALRNPALALCIRNIAHARRKKESPPT